MQTRVKEHGAGAKEHSESIEFRVWELVVHDAVVIGSARHVSGNLMAPL